MTAARDEWLRARQRKRAVVSWAAALGAYLVAFAVAAVLSLFYIDDLADYSGPIVVRLGSADGADAARPVPEQPAPVSPETAAIPETKPESPAPIVPIKPTPTPAPSVPAKAPKPTPSVPAPSPESSLPPAPAPVVIRGSESGNSYDMTFISGSGVVGRSFYVPIWLFMPVPYDIPGSLYDRIPDQAGLSGTAEARKKVFASHYVQAGDTWRLKRNAQPDYDIRPTIWIMLEDAGYDVKKADYKDGKSLRPVVVLFKVSAPGPDGKPSLEAVHIESGSGYSTIDDDVLYGFKKAEFSNSGASSISGRFTYRF
ncbi:MAG: hypothetical protein KKA67_03665 [Spirochaetes bacterium]|nr:hypothetical protein [Spirochaetota bacterium]MBU1082167.1 hypothetical protein [Spirochaetota bacterium]